MDIFISSIITLLIGIFIGYISNDIIEFIIYFIFKNI